MAIPTDPISLAIYLIDALFAGEEAVAAFGRLSNGIAARAQNEGREVTADEQVLIKALRDESDRRVAGA